MAGFVCVFSDDGRTPVPPHVLDGLISAYGHVRGEGRVHARSAGTWARCAAIDGHIAAHVHDEEGAWCVGVGALHAAGSSAQAPLDDIDGQFAAVRYRPSTDGLELFNDQFSSQSLYMARRDGRSYVSTCATALARHLEATPDPLGAALFLRTGRQFGPVSHWQGVRRLDPATLVTVSDRGVQEQQYWRPSLDPRVRDLPFAATVDHCAEVLVAAIDRRLRAEPCLAADLTGGFDSRLMTAALLRAGLSFGTQTAGETETVDVRLAREVAAAGGFPWHQERIPESWSPDLEALSRAAGWSDGMLEVCQLSEVLERQAIRAQGCEVVVTGGGGEHFGPYPWFHELWRAGRSREVNFGNFMSMRALTGSAPSALRVDPTPAVGDYMRDRLRRYSSQVADELNTVQCDLMYQYMAVGHFGAYRSASEAFVRTEIPAYYRDVFTAGFSANPRHRNGHRLHRAMIARLHPRMGAVETERGGPAGPMTARNAHRFAPYYWRLGRTAVRKIRRSPARASADDGIHAGQRRAAATLRAEGVLDPAQMRSGECYDPAALQALADPAAAPDASVLSVIGRVATLELVLRCVPGATLSSLTT